MENFGNRVRLLRKGRELTLTKLAAMLDMDSANLSKIETGKRSFDEKKLPLFCKIFSLDLEKMKAELFSEKIAKKVYSEHINDAVFTMAKKRVKYLISNE